MARPQRNNVDYFPFLCKEGETLFYLEETYGNDGFAVFIKLLRELAKTDFHYLDTSKNTKMMFLKAKCKVSKETLIAIISDLVELDKFDAELWNENGIIWCQDFVNSIQDAYNKRTNNCIDRNGLLLLLDSLGVRKQPKRNPKPVKTPSEVPVNPQSIVEYSKEEESKEGEGTAPTKFKKFKPPDKDSILAYMQFQGLKKELAGAESEKFMNHYISVGWTVGGKAKMVDWQSAVCGWISKIADFKPSNKANDGIPNEPDQAALRWYRHFNRTPQECMEAKKKWLAAGWVANETATGILIDFKRKK